MKAQWLTMKAGALLAAAMLAANLGAQNDDFEAGNDNGWTRYSPLADYGASGTFTVANGRYRIQAPLSPAPSQLGPGRAGALLNQISLATFRIAVDLTTWNDSLDQAFGILARVREPGLGTLDGYALTYVNERGTTAATLQLLRVQNESDSGGTLTTTSIQLNPAVGYRLVFTGIGNSLTGAVYALSDLTIPLATLSANNTEYASGGCGLFVYDNSGGSGTADATFDNFSAGPPPAPLTVFPATNQLFALSWPEWGGEYSLEARSSLLTGGWSTVLGPFTIANGQISHATNALGAARYYRLVWRGP